MSREVSEEEGDQIVWSSKKIKEGDSSNQEEAKDGAEEEELFLLATPLNY